MRLADKMSLSRVATGWVAALVGALAYYKIVPIQSAQIAAIGLLLYGAVSDFFDGRVARAEAIREGGPSAHGGRLDPWCDKAEKFPNWIVYVALGWIPLWLVLPILFRDIVSAGYREIMPPKKDNGDSDLAGKVKTWAQYFVLIGTPATMLIGWEKSWVYGFYVFLLVGLSGITLWATVMYVRVKGPRAYAYLQQRNLRREDRPRRRARPAAAGGSK